MAVVDASLWVSICHFGDRHHARSKSWLEGRVLEGEPIAAPNLLRVEVAAAVRRLTGDEHLAVTASLAFDRADWLELHELTAERAQRAAEIAIATGVRGADAIYLELAVQRGEELVTWDRQQLERGRSLARVVRP